MRASEIASCLASSASRSSRCVFMFSFLTSTAFSKLASRFIFLSRSQNSSWSLRASASALSLFHNGSGFSGGLNLCRIFRITFFTASAIVALFLVHFLQLGKQLYKERRFTHF